MLGVPHLVTKDDVYKEFHIPKDSMVVANIWLVWSDIVGKLDWLKVFFCSCNIGVCCRTKLSTQTRQHSDLSAF